VQNEEIKLELNDLKDSDGEEIYENVNKNVRRPNEENESGEDGENIEDNIDNVQVGEKRQRKDDSLVT
jgi:hypothetical protein